MTASLPSYHHTLSLNTTSSRPEDPKLATTVAANILAPSGTICRPPARILLIMRFDVYLHFPLVSLISYNLRCQDYVILNHRIDLAVLGTLKMLHKVLWFVGEIVLNYDACHITERLRNSKRHTTWLRFWHLTIMHIIALCTEAWDSHILDMISC